MRQGIRVAPIVPFIGPIALLMVRPDAPFWPLMLATGLVLGRVLEPELIRLRGWIRRLQNLVLLLVLLALVVFAPAPVLDWFARFATLLGLSLAVSPHEPNRGFKLFVVTFLLVLLAGAQTEEIRFAFPFLAFVLLIPRALAEVDLEGAPAAPPSFMGTGFGLAALAGVLFFLIPRGSGTMMGRGMLAPSLPAAMGERLHLDSITDIKQSPRVAMRVKVDRPVGPDTKWRGVAFDRYDGRSWDITTPRTEAIKAGNDLQLSLRDPRSDDRLIRQEFVIEPGLSSNLFSIPLATRIDLPKHERLRGLARAGFNLIYLRGHDLSLGFLPRGSIAYEIVSDPAMVDEQAWTPDDRRRYLQLPPQPPEVAALARQVTAGAGSDRQRLDRLQRFFHEEFAYSLQVVRDPDRNPLEDFLFNQRRGHCEFFASAMVVMARSLDIPARLVDGFTRGEYSELSDSYLVRRSDAHAWVEAWIEGEGWVSADPTPPAPPEGSISAFFSRVRSGVVELWTRYVTDYGVIDQRLFLGVLLAWVSGLAKWIGWIVGLGLIAWLLWLLRLRAPARQRGSVSEMGRIVLRAAGGLEKLGVRLRPGETLGQLAERAGSIADLPSLRRLVDLHQVCVYGDRGPDAASLGEARRLAAALRGEIRAARRTA